MTVGNIKPILDLAATYDPCSFGMTFNDVATVYMWITEGCDIEKDIVPVMREAMKRKSGIKTFSYFTNPVRGARDKREMQAKMKEESSKPVDQEKLAKVHAWKRKMDMQYDQEFLSQYELHHGRVEA